MSSQISKPSSSPHSGQASSPAGSAQRSIPRTPPNPLSPFHGNYPTAPHLRPISLPEVTPVLPLQRSLAPTPFGGAARTTPPSPALATTGSHSRGNSLPTPFSMPGSMLFGMPPAMFQNQLELHALLRSNNGASPIYYNVLLQPNLRNPSALHHTSVQLREHDLHCPGIYPPCGSITASVAAYPSPTSPPIRFPWKITLTSPRRSSTPAPGQVSAVTVYDALASVWASLNRPVREELNQFRPDQLAAASVQRDLRIAARAVPNADPNTFVRSDFLYGCIVFAGFTVNPDNSLTVTLVPQTN